MVEMKEWDGFDGRLWKEEINVRQFIRITTHRTKVMRTFDRFDRVDQPFMGCTSEIAKRGTCQGRRA